MFISLKVRKLKRIANDWFILTISDILVNAANVAQSRSASLVQVGLFCRYLHNNSS